MMTAVEISVSFTWRLIITATETVTVKKALVASTSCMARKRRVVSTSDVQRWMRSPVSALTW